MKLRSERCRKEQVANIKNMHGWLDIAVVLHCRFVLFRRMKLFATTKEIASDFKPPPQKHMNFPPLQHKH